MYDENITIIKQSFKAFGTLCLMGEITEDDEVVVMEKLNLLEAYGKIFTEIKTDLYELRKILQGSDYVSKGLYIAEIENLFTIHNELVFMDTLDETDLFVQK